MYEEAEGYDEIREYPFDGEGEGDTLFPSVWLANVGDVLNSQPKSLVYVVGYNGEASVPGAWRRMAQNQIEILKKAGVEASRFKTVYGGNEEKPKTQIWVQAASDQPPVKDAGAEPTPKVTLQLGDFGDLDLGGKEFERQAFTRMLETLQAFPTVRACLIVRPAQAVSKEEESGVFMPVQQVDADGLPLPVSFEPDLEPADLLKLVESWKSELAKKNIREDRVVILFSKALADYPGSLETWLVPIGQPLPDPEAIFKEDKP
jgi:hypothetical protein